MMSIKMTKTSIVKPAEKTVRRSIPLTVLDRTFTFPRYNSLVNIYPPTEAVDAAALRESLSKTLVHFYPMAGRCRLDCDGVMEIDCNDQGVSFIEAKTESDLAALGNLAPSTEMSLLLPPIDESTRDISYYPMMAVQVTYFNCGGVAICVRVEHQSGDGSSTFHFIKSWSKIARGGGISVAPIFDRTSYIRPRDPPRPQFDHPENSHYGHTTQISSTLTIDVTISVFQLTRDQLDQMKADGCHRYSTFDVLAGHIWKCVCKARGLGCEEETRLLFPVDARFGNRWKPELPRGFFGNAIFCGMAVARAGDLESEPIHFAAAKIHETLLWMDSEYLRSSIDHLALLPDDVKASKLGPHILYGPNFQITSWGKIGLTDADFGRGPPIYSGPGNIKYEKAYIFPSDSQNGGISVAIALRPQYMEIFEKLFYNVQGNKKHPCLAKL